MVHECLAQSDVFVLSSFGKFRCRNNAESRKQGSVVTPGLSRKGHQPSGGAGRWAGGSLGAAGGPDPSSGQASAPPPSGC